MQLRNEHAKKLCANAGLHSTYSALSSGRRSCRKRARQRCEPLDSIREGGRCVGSLKNNRKRFRRPDEQQASGAERFDKSDRVRRHLEGHRAARAIRLKKPVERVDAWRGCRLTKAIDR